MKKFPKLELLERQSKHPRIYHLDSSTEEMYVISSFIVDLERDTSVIST